MSQKSLFAVSVLALACAACPGPYDPGGLAVTLSDAQCNYYYNCCAAAERQSSVFVGGSYIPHANVDECKDEFSTVFASAFAPYEEARAEGRIEWDADGAASCFQPFVEAAQQCDAEGVAGGLGGCDLDAFATGLVDDGAPCYASYECATEGAVCNIDTGDEDTRIVTFTGECKPPLREGETCFDVDQDIDNTCGPGLYCDFGEGDCTSFANVGQSCADRSCDPDTAFCDFDTDTCTAKKQNGAECNNDSECLSDDCDFFDGVCVGDDVGDETDTVYDMCDGEPLGT